MSMKIALFILMAASAVIAAPMLAGIYAELFGIKPSPEGVLLGLFWGSLWYGMFARGPINPKSDKTDNERPQE